MSDKNKGDLEKALDKEFAVLMAKIPKDRRLVYIKLHDYYEDTFFEVMERFNFMRLQAKYYSNQKLREMLWEYNFIDSKEQSVIGYCYACKKPTIFMYEGKEKIGFRKYENYYKCVLCGNKINEDYFKKKGGRK